MRSLVPALLGFPSVAAAEGEQPPVVVGVESVPQEVQDVLRYRPHWVLDAEFGLAVFSDQQDFARALAGGLRGGYRFMGRFGVVLETEFNTWRSPTLEGDETESVSVVNVGVGVDFHYADGWVRTSLSMGPSILVDETTVDSGPGSVGYYLHLRPVGAVLPLYGTCRVGIDPISFYLAIPDLGGIPLEEVQYRTSLYAEARF